jgi:hypothetical protein
MVMIGVDPHKRTHTASATPHSEKALLLVRMIRAAFVAAADELEDHVRGGPGRRVGSRLRRGPKDGGAQVGLEFLGEPADGLGGAESTKQSSRLVK